MRGSRNSIDRSLKILGSLAAVSVSVFLLILLMQSAPPIVAAAPLQSSSWSTYIDSKKDDGDDEYGYQYGDSDFDDIDDRDFRFGGNSYNILYLKWEDAYDEVQFKLDDCLKPSELTSIKFEYDNKIHTLTRKRARYNDSHCEGRRSSQQIFEFDTSVNPLPADTRVKVTLNFNTGSGGGTNPTPTRTPVNTPVPTQPPSSTASLSPDPSHPNINFRPDGKWRGFTVRSSGPVMVYVNPGTTPRNVEINTNNSGNFCGNGAEREGKPRRNGQTIYLAGCNAGKGTVQLQTLSGTEIRTYTFSIGSGGGTNPTPTRTPVSTPTPAPTALDINVGLKVVSKRGNSNVSTPFASFKWQIPDYVYAKLTDIPSNVSARDYEYRIIAPENTGIQATWGTTACNWNASGSSWPSESLWVDANGGQVPLVRCGLGNAATRLTVQMRKKSDRTNVDRNSYSAVVKHPWHIADNKVTYAFATDLVSGVSPTPASSVTSRYKEGVNQGAGKWNAAGTGMLFTKVALTAGPDVIVQGYSSGGTDRCKNPIAVACVPYSLFTVYPHFNRQQRFWFEHEPAIGSTRYDWTNSYVLAVRNRSLLYMPILMAHEFGHTAGLWHSPGSSDAMFHAATTLRQNLSGNDKNAMKAIYRNHRTH